MSCSNPPFWKKNLAEVPRNEKQLCFLVFPGGLHCFSSQWAAVSSSASSIFWKPNVWELIVNCRCVCVILSVISKELMKDTIQPMLRGGLSIAGHINATMCVRVCVWNVKVHKPTKSSLIRYIICMPWTVYSGFTVTSNKTFCWR